MKKIIALLICMSMLAAVLPCGVLAASIVDSGTCGKNLTWTLNGDGVLIISGTGDMEDWIFEDDVPWYSSKSSIKSVTIESGVTSIGEGAFSDCTNLTSIDIPGSVTSIGEGAFEWCESLASITVSETNEAYKDIDGVLFDKTGEILIEHPVGKEAVSYTVPAGVTRIGDYAFSSCYSLTSVTIPDSVTRIGNYAFVGCTSLTSITIPDSVTSIGEGAFWCTNLASITIPDSVTSIGEGAFESCMLPSITIPDSVTSIGEGAFKNCPRLTSITVSESNEAYKDIDGVLFDKAGKTLIKYPERKEAVSYTVPGSVTSIGDHAFYDCTNLTNVTIPKGVTSIGKSAFQWCESLTSITIPDSVISIESAAFIDCTSLASVTIANSVTSIEHGAFNNTAYYNDEKNWEDGVLYIGNHLIEANGDILPENYVIKSGTRCIADEAFYHCYSLASVTIPNSVTSIGWEAFDSCTSLTSITIPDGVTSIEDWAFFYCRSLANVTIPNSVTSIGDYAFEWCDSLKDVYYGGSEEDWAKIEIGTDNDCLLNAEINYNSSMPGNEITASGTCGDNLTWKLGDNGTLTISGTGEMNKWDYFSSAPWYDNRSSVKSVVIGSGVTRIGDYAFYNCNSITSITIPDSITSIGKDAFSSCYSLASITIPKGVTSIGDYAFSSCDSLTSVTIPEGMTSIGNNAFDHCTSLTSITIPEGMTSIGDYAFSFCESLASVTIPRSVTSIGMGAFYYCESLKSIEVSEGNLNYSSNDGVLFDKSKTTLIEYPIGKTQSEYKIPDGVVSIGNVAFAGCISLESVAIPNSVTNIGGEAFGECISLASITIPEGVTSIGDYAFSSCDSLTSVTIPEGMTSIGNNAFDSCTSLTDVYYSGSEENWAEIEIGTGNDCLLNANIHLYEFDEPTPYQATLALAGGLSGSVTQNMTIIITTAPQNAHEGAYVAWSVADPTIAEVVSTAGDYDNLATIMGIGTGETTVTATLYDKDGNILDYKIITLTVTGTSAGGDLATLTVGTVSARAGETVTVPITISDNTGIAGFNLVINYDNTLLTPVSIEKGSALTVGTLTSNIQQGGDLSAYEYVTAYWVNPSNVTENGEILNVTFEIAADAEEGDISVTVTYENGDVTNQDYEDIALEITDGAVTVINILPGDVTGDGTVNRMDLLRLGKFFAGWDVDIDEAAADVTGDGTVNRMDLLRLGKFFAGWDVTLGK